MVPILDFLFYVSVNALNKTLLFNYWGFKYTLLSSGATFFHGLFKKNLFILII